MKKYQLFLNVSILRLKQQLASAMDVADIKHMLNVIEKGYMQNNAICDHTQL
jgi:hypothetical protein